MIDNSQKPKEHDLVLGSHSTVLANGVVLGGLERIKQLMAYGTVEEKIDVLLDAFEYGDAGLDLIIQVLQNSEVDVTEAAYSLLQESTEPRVKLALQAYNPYPFFEYLFTIERYTMGTAKAGFHHLALVERDKHSCHTIRENQQRSNNLVANWRLHQMDVADFDISTIDGEIDLLAGGPPCQPFSIGGRHGAYVDERDMFPQFFQAVRELRPKAFLIENVRGLLRQNLINYFEYIILQLAHPEVLLNNDESWVEHVDRLKHHHSGAYEDSLGYKVSYKLLNAAAARRTTKTRAGFYCWFQV